LMRPVVGRCGWEYAQAVGRPLLAAVLMGCAVSLVAPAFPVVPGAIVSIVGGGMLYLSLLWLFDRALLAEVRGFPSRAMTKQK
jgi:ABC-type uncharacterized transport system permease subunit